MLILLKASLNLILLSAYELFFLWPPSFGFGLCTLYGRHWFLFLYCSGFTKVLEVSGSRVSLGGAGGGGDGVFAYVENGVSVEGWALFQKVLHSPWGQSYLQSQVWDMPRNKENQQVSSESSTNPQAIPSLWVPKVPWGDFLTMDLAS